MEIGIENISFKDLRDNKFFRTFLNKYMDKLSLDSESVARLVDVSRPSVERWKKGETVPHQIIRKLVFEEFKKLILIRRKDV